VPNHRRGGGGCPVKRQHFLRTFRAPPPPSVVAGFARRRAPQRSFRRTGACGTRPSALKPWRTTLRPVRTSLFLPPEVGNQTPPRAIGATRTYVQAVAVTLDL
jgi:hypothetical protein